MYDDALDMLSKLHILHISGKLSLNTTFKTSLRHAITGGYVFCLCWTAFLLITFRGTTGSFGVPAEKDEKRPPMDIEGLDGYALERWEVRDFCLPRETPDDGEL